MTLNRTINLLMILLLSRHSFAASCCGGGFSFPALILGDDKAQITSSLSTATVSDDVLNNGFWIHRRDNNSAQIFKLEGAALISDRFQFGASVPLVYKSNEIHSSASGVGDVSLFLGHESFPERTFSRYTPKGVSFLQLQLPTSPSIYDSSAETANESRGRGFYSLGAGIALIKSLRVWDFNYTGELHYSFAKKVDSMTLGGTTRLKPGFGTSHALGAGWNKGPYRVGFAASMLFEEAIEALGLNHALNSLGSSQQSFTGTLLASYMPSMESAWTLSYADQTLLGNPSNTSLTKTINISYQQRWPR